MLIGKDAEKSKFYKEMFYKSQKKNFNEDKERILIVDDEPFNILALKTVMQTVTGIINVNSICD